MIATVMPLVATHRAIKDFTWHIWEEHVYSGPIPPDDDPLEQAQFHTQLHMSGLGHKDADERPMRALK